MLTGVGEPEAALEWKRKLRSFIDTECIPLELQADENDGQLPDEVKQKHRQAARDMGLWLPNVPKEFGGAGLSASEIVAVEEEVGRATNGVGFFFHDVSPFLVRTATPWQMETYVQPMLDGERNECYAITEEGAGSDVDAIQATARKEGNGYVLSGLKWHVTGFNKADVIVFQAKLEDGQHGLFYVDRDAAGVEVVRTPAYSHTYPAHHPIVRFNDVKVTADALIDPDGNGITWTYEWFRQERLGVAARCCGAASRLIDEALKFAEERVQFGKPIIENQAIAFMLADSLVELWAGRLMIYRLGQAIDAGEDVKVQHAMCSMAKLYCSEMANRVADRAVQIFGGRGYMREYAAERFYRELRVDRIWEGTSEIQRMIIAQSLVKRGQDALIG
ncbi:MAG: acyl-CoA dehydrogenase family protein [Rhodospirillaceae bacterium]|nr:acyl-CoA dehydrogenase family protein [Rhodospirillaceae bacterium]MBT6202905.1 acyl-CoA dehydrogenase family protein [Rhodospirillaceae bacterium]MBT6509310.1 acyl-CoA dehydrogenase family protein [Rhodospirillaceae bacterium]MBT7613877.1 acyl-CoA dehydrogenase family protein [Rhodospirillaceae bacterium]